MLDHQTTDVEIDDEKTMNKDHTLFQKLVNNEDVPQMINDLRNLENVTPEDTDPSEVDGFELAVTFDYEDVPSILGELEELADERE